MIKLIKLKALFSVVLFLASTLFSSTSSALVNYSCDLELSYTGSWMRNNCVLDVYGEVLTDGPDEYPELITLYNDTTGNYDDGSSTGSQHIYKADTEGIGLNDVSNTTSTFLSTTHSGGVPTYGAVNSWEINYTWSADTWAYGPINWIPLCIQGEIEILTFIPNPPGGGPNQSNTSTFAYISGECKNIYGL